MPFFTICDKHTSSAFVLCTDRRRSVIGTFAAHITSDTFREMIDQSQRQRYQSGQPRVKGHLCFTRAILLASYVGIT